MRPQSEMGIYSQRYVSHYYFMLVDIETFNIKCRLLKTHWLCSVSCCQASQEQKVFFRLHKVAKVTESTHLILFCSLLDAIDFFSTLQWHMGLYTVIMISAESHLFSSGQIWVETSWIQQNSIRRSHRQKAPWHFWGLLSICSSRKKEKRKINKSKSNLSLS